MKKDEILKQQNKHPTEVLREQGRECYIKKLSDADIFLPMDWKQYMGKYKAVLFDPTSGDCIQEVESDDQTFREIEKLFQDTHDASQVGYGSDARGLIHTNMKIKNIERIENPDTFENYANYRKAMCLKHLRDGQVPSVALKCDRSSGEIYEDLVTEINECYLFHGTIVDNKEAIRRQGLDPRVSGVGLFGRGIYFTDSSTKADQYTGKLCSLYIKIMVTMICKKYQTIATSVNNWVKFKCKPPGKLWNVEYLVESVVFSKENLNVLFVLKLYDFILSAEIVLLWGPPEVMVFALLEQI